MLDEILAIVLAPVVGDEQVGGLIRSRLGMERLRAAWAVKQERLPRDHGSAAESGDVTAYRHYWELCVLVGLRDGLRSGNVFVPGSRRYADPASFPAHFRGVGAAADRVLHPGGEAR